MSEDPVVLVSPKGHEVTCGDAEVRSGKYVDLLALGYQKKKTATRKPTAVRSTEQRPPEQPKSE